jgi:DNA modification methylase
MDRARDGEAMKTFYDGKVILHAGDCMEVLKAMPENSIDAVVTDPPYHLTVPGNKSGRSNLEQPANKDVSTIKSPAFRAFAKGFMGQKWDGGDIAFRPELWAEVLRVLKPGGHIVAFSGTRTYHRMAVAIDDAGFEIRDQLAWVYGSGFPKSHDVSKGIDRAAGAKRTERIGVKPGHEEFADRPGSGHLTHLDGNEGWQRPWQHGENANDYHYQFAPATDAARQWQGWGTALKPAWEPICLARKPLSESTVAANVLRWGTGAINIDGCRVPTNEKWDSNELPNAKDGVTWGGDLNKQTSASHKLGRWPANLCHDGSPEVMAGFPDSNSNEPRISTGSRQRQSGFAMTDGNGGFSDSGSAARFFYTAKADWDDRLNSKHPTVKPVGLMQWLVRLVCLKGATVLDPFAGTGTTGAASFIEGRRCVLIEREAECLADIEKRMGMLLSGSEERSWKLAKSEPLEALPLFALPEPAE